MEMKSEKPDLFADLFIPSKFMLYFDIFFKTRPRQTAGAFCAIRAI